MDENSIDDSCSFRGNDDPSLLRVATDILSGIDKQVEVEFMSKNDTISGQLFIIYIFIQIIFLSSRNLHETG